MVKARLERKLSVGKGNAFAWETARFSGFGVRSMGGDGMKKPPHRPHNGLAMGHCKGNAGAM